MRAAQAAASAGVAMGFAGGAGFATGAANSAGGTAFAGVDTQNEKPAAAQSAASADVAVSAE